MSRWTQKAAGFCSAALVIVAVACVAGRLPAVAAQNTAMAAAGFILPGGAKDAIMSDYLEEDEEDNAPEGSSGAGQDSHIPSSESLPQSESASAAPSSGTVASSGASSVPVSSAPPASTSLPSGVQEVALANAGTQYKNIWVRNYNKNHGIDIAAELAKQPAIKIIKNSTPQVLIYHTHTTEAFLGDTRSQDPTRSVVAVGDQIASQLKAAGINVFHDTTMHDYPSYNGSYDRSKVTVQNDLKKYPGLQVTLDIHRDAMGTANGTRIKPTAVINGQKAAQLMIISGCDDDGTLGFPNWEYNLRFAVRLQKSLSEMYPGLARPLDFAAKKYNENLTKGSLLIEIGTEVNTLDEVKRTGEFLGKALVDTLNQLT